MSYAALRWLQIGRTVQSRRRKRIWSRNRRKMSTADIRAEPLIFSLSLSLSFFSSVPRRRELHASLTASVGVHASARASRPRVGIYGRAE